MGRRQFGAIRRLPSGRWQARFPAPGGRLVPAEKTFSTKAEAGRYLSEVEARMARGEWTHAAASRVRLDDYAWAWLTGRRVRGRPLAPRTVDSYRHSLSRWILPTLGQLTLDRLTPTKIRGWHTEVSGRTGPTATRQAYSVLRAILNTAVEDELLSRNPCKIRGAGQPTSPERPLLDPATVQQLAAAMPPHLRALTLTAFYAHTRLGEVVALEHRDVDLDAGTLRVERQQIEVTGEGPRVTGPKASSVRLVHLPSPGLAVLRAHLEATGRALPHARLFTRADGLPLRGWDVNWAWRQAREAVGLPTVRFHDLRHAGLTLSAQAGATLAEVMRRAGHSSSAAALGYQHAAAHRDAEIAARLTELLARGEPGA
jgi:integrase